METKLKRISEISQKNPKGIFTSIGHLINKDMLKLCHNEMDKNKAVGIDGISKELYHENLEENLDKLVEALKRKSYKPQPVRQVPFNNIIDVNVDEYNIGKWEARKFKWVIIE